MHNKHSDTYFYCTCKAFRNHEDPMYLVYHSSCVTLTVSAILNTRGESIEALYTHKQNTKIHMIKLVCRIKPRTISCEDLTKIPAPTK